MADRIGVSVGFRWRLGHWLFALFPCGAVGCATNAAQPPPSVRHSEVAAPSGDPAQESIQPQPDLLAEPEPLGSSEVRSGALPSETVPSATTEVVVSSFVLTDPGPMYERSARAGDGVWRGFFARAGDSDHERRTQPGVAEDFAEAGLRRMVLHPHPQSRFQTLVLAAFDLQRLRVEHRPGAQDIVDLGHPELAPLAGLVAEEHLEDLLAVFNGGFQPRHGKFGMRSLGQQLIPPRQDACTVAILKDGTVAIAPWPELAPQLSEIVAYRQTPPCLVQEGEVHPLLRQGKRAAWAGQQPSVKTRRRSLVGVSRDGRALFVGLGSETEAEVLAAGAKHAGAHAAAQLDINWNWTRLFVFDSGQQKDAPQLQGSLVPDMAKDKGEYLKKPAARDFFYVYRR